MHLLPERLQATVKIFSKRMRVQLSRDEMQRKTVRLSLQGGGEPRQEESSARAVPSGSPAPRERSCTEGKVPWVVLRLPPFLIHPGVPTTVAPGPGSVSVMRREDTEISGSEGGNIKEEDLENTVN